MPSHSYLKLRHFKPFLNPIIIILKYGGGGSILKSLSLFFKEGVLFSVFGKGIISELWVS